MSEVTMIARIRKLLEGVDRVGPGVEDQVSLNEQLELLVAIATSPYGEIVKVGRAFEVHTTAAVAAVIAVPTTANLLNLWNGEADGDGRSLVIDRVWALMAASGATAGQAALIGALGQTRVTQGAAQALALNPLNGLGGKDSKVGISIAVLDAVTGVAANWRVLPGQSGGMHVGAAATPGVFVNAEVNGRIIVPPGRLFGVHVLADAATSTFTVGIEWHERKITLG